MEIYLRFLYGIYPNSWDKNHGSTFIRKENYGRRNQIYMEKNNC